MKQLLITILACSFSFISCEQKTTSSVAVQDSSSTPATAEIEKDIEWKGFFVYNDSVRFFRKISDSKTYNLKDESGKLSEAYLKALFNPYRNETAYLSFKGTLTVLNGQSDSTVIIKEIKEVNSKSFREKNFEFDFFAIGNEPNWSLEIIKQENIISFKDFSNNTVSVFEYVIPKTEQKETIYAAQKARIVFEKRKCSDGMSEIQYDYAATITLNGKTFRGCAISYK